MELILYSGAGCSLCDQLEERIQPYVDRLRHRFPMTFVKRDISDDPVWLDEFRDRIPVLVCDGRIVLEGNPSSDQVDVAMSQLG